MPITKVEPPISLVEPPIPFFKVLEEELAQEYGADLYDTPEGRIYQQERTEGLRKYGISAEAWKTGAQMDEKLLPGIEKLNKELAPKLSRLILGLERKRSALCLSGGGIRSATFNLGILQGLARHKLLGEFDYLSTVSGGGFIGGWLTAWITRKGLQPVLEGLCRQLTSMLTPEPDPIYQLRTYSNYLSPKKGLLNADTWTLIKVYFRNLLLNWLVFLPVIMTVLFLPRLWVALLLKGISPTSVTTINLLVTSLSLPTHTIFNWICVGGAFVLETSALIFIVLNLPSTDKRNDDQSRFVTFGLAPQVLSAMALVLYWAHAEAASDFTEWLWRIAVFVIVTLMPPWIVCCFIHWSRPSANKGRVALILLLATVIIIAAGFIIGGVTGGLTLIESLHLKPPLNLAQGHARMFACLAVPLILAVLLLSGTLLAGFTSRWTDDADQEWWARSGAWLIIVIIGWLAGGCLVLIGPSLLMMLPADIEQLKRPGIKEALTGLVTVITGAVSLIGGFSAKTSAKADENAQAGLASKILGIVTTISAVIFLACIFIFLAWGTDGLLLSAPGRWMSERITGQELNFPGDHRSIIYLSSSVFLLAAAVVFGMLGRTFGWLISTNRFSLHYYWRNRILRAYLGASRDKADGAESTNRSAWRGERGGNKFTGFDPQDDLPMAEAEPLLRPPTPAATNQPTNAAPSKQHKLLHIINMALNLVGGDNLAWQDRKAESFTVSPLHSGSYWLGHSMAEASSSARRSPSPARRLRRTWAT